MPIICCKKDVYMLVSDSAEADNGVDFDEIFDRHFEVDELIALPIIELNKKGYVTTYSCSGHPFFWNLSYKHQEDEEQDYNEAIFHDEDDELYFYADRTSIEEAYIAFAENYEFRKLPDGWWHDRDRNAIRFTFQMNVSALELHKAQMTAMHNLYLWTCSLDNIGLTLIS